MAKKNNGILPLDLPVFKSEDEEAEWLYQNRDKIDEMMVRFGKVNEPLKIVSLRLSQLDIERAKKLAAKQKVGYLALLRELIVEGLKPSRPLPEARAQKKRNPQARPYEAVNSASSRRRNPTREKPVPAAR